jgi:hypothetical protein
LPFSRILRTPKSKMPLFASLGSKSELCVKDEILSYHLRNDWEYIGFPLFLFLNSL